MLPRGYRDLRLGRHARERCSQITRVRIPKGIWPTDVFPPIRCLTRLPFEGLVDDEDEEDEEGFETTCAACREKQGG